MAKPIPKQKLLVYLAVSEAAISSILIKKASRVQMPVYYINKQLLDIEMRYLEFDILTLALIITT